MLPLFIDGYLQVILPFSLFTNALNVNSVSLHKKTNYSISYKSRHSQLSNFTFLSPQLTIKQIHLSIAKFGQFVCTFTSTVHGHPVHNFILRSTKPSGRPELTPINQLLLQNVLHSRIHFQVQSKRLNHQSAVCPMQMSSH